VNDLADKRNLLSKKHFSVDGTLMQAWASQKSFRPMDEDDDQTSTSGGHNSQADWKGPARSNDTDASRTDPDVRLYHKSSNTAAILSYRSHVLMENRNGLVVSPVVTADGMRACGGLAMLDTVPSSQPKTVGADKAYNTADFVADCRARNIVPHFAQNDTRCGGSAIDARTTRHDGYQVS
jgi:hypothetical protein